MASADHPQLGFLMEMGFERTKAEKALRVTGSTSVEAAMEWILAHPDDDGSSSAEGDVRGDSETVRLNLTPEELEEQAKRLEERRVKRRAEIAEQERKAEIEREKNRRLSGKEIQDARDKAHQAEMVRYAAERKKEKDDDKKARQRILDVIAEDRLKKEAEKNAEKDKAAGLPTSDSLSRTTVSAAFAAPSGSGNHTQTRIQIRMMDGTPLTQTFGVNEPLGSVRLYAQLNRKDGESSPFGLMTTFPRRDFTDEDMLAPLSALGLVPSATLIAKRQ
ncbi:putative UBX domain-containing protein 1 [Hypsibius exemplaris]|uniref:UBX domain-containing protein 1 n=1 Tax=Hypsibius exemplaris TaxID=2072580 RepID=A0A1W0WQS2_HYPEX|nr:putative UBX domain-containing protein 1 [Hypsibius exemplaris]